MAACLVTVPGAVGWAKKRGVLVTDSDPPIVIVGWAASHVLAVRLLVRKGFDGFVDGRFFGHLCVSVFGDWRMCPTACAVG